LKSAVSDRLRRQS
jgi:TIGR00275: flavoprotein, HI0933 family